MAHAIPAPAGRILILNPLGNGSTSRKHAKAYIRRGLAEWVKPEASIRFRRGDADHRELSAAISVARYTGLNYDRINRLQPLKATRNLPMPCAEIAYGMGNSGPRGGSHIAAQRGAYPSQRWNGYEWEEGE